MTPADLPAAMALKDAAGWNQTEQDWRLLLALQPDGCFVLEQDGKVVASATAYCYERELAWIGMVLTLPEYRGRGFGNQVFLKTVEFCRERGIRSVKLDATDMGQPLYERAGFAGEYQVERWGGVAVPASNALVDTLTTASLEDQMPADAAAFGVDRSTLLRALHARQSWSGAVDTEGYAMARPGTRAHYFGPCMAATPDAARALLAGFLAMHAGEPVFADIPVPNASARDILKEAGLEVRRTLLRMVLGENSSPGEPSRIYGLAGFEYG